MIEINEAIIRKLIFHRISNENNNSFLNDNLYDFENEEEQDIVKKIFLKPFISSITTYEFKHDIDIELNTLYKLSKLIYEDDNFLDKSKNILQHLKSVSKHPNIKDGELFIIKYDDIKIKNKFYEALGIYKIENKETYLETTSVETGRNYLNFKKGIGGKKLDKACLIVFTEDPYTLFIIDNGSTETDYWKNEFINVNYKNDYINNTNQFLTLTKSFVKEQFPNEYEITKADQIDLLNKSVDYFKKHENFNKNEFENEIFQDNGVIKSFRNFDETYRANNNIASLENFEISQDAVKRQARAFKSILKLDKNFHIYIHGHRELIEQGVDNDGRKYYKIYYQEEN